MARFFGISTETIKHGKDNLDFPKNPPDPKRQHHKGAGHKGVFAEQPKLEAAFDTLIESHLGGDSMNANVVWTDLQSSGIAAALVKQGFSISVATARDSNVAMKKRP